jgi:hypothetical protein
MDKKILLGGAAALLLVGNMYATPASAAIDLSFSGEGEVSFLMSDQCGDAAATASDVDTVFGTSNSNVSYATDQSTDGDMAMTFTSYACSGSASEDNPVISLGNKLEFEAAGTLANGLEVSYSDAVALDDSKLSFGGAFGTLTFADGLSAIDESAVGDVSGADVTGSDFGGHKKSTSGAAGMSILYTAPSVGGIDIMIGYNPNSADSGLDSAAYLDTFSFAAVMAMDSGLTVSAGMESASDNSGATCGPAGFTATTATTDTAQDAYDLAYGGDICGDESLIYVGAEMSLSDLAVSASYSDLDSDEADQSTWAVGVGTDVGAYSVAVDYTKSTLDYAAGGVSDEQTVIHAGISTALGDGVDLSLDFSTNEYDQASQAQGAGATNNYRAEMKVTVGF